MYIRKHKNKGNLFVYRLYIKTHIRMTTLKNQNYALKHTLVLFYSKTHIHMTTFTNQHYAFIVRNKI